jgi:hypothetical protein
VTEAVRTAEADGQIRQFNGLAWVPVPTGWTPTEPVARGTLMLSARAYWAMPEIPDGASVSLDLTVAGVTPHSGWVFEVTSSVSARLLAVQAHATAENVVTLTATNMTGATVRLPACMWRVYGWR